MSLMPIDELAPKGYLARGYRAQVQARLHARAQPTDLSKSALVFAPHQDDEVLGCGGTIIKKVARGAEVRIVFMTNGCGSHASMMEPDELIAMRRSEAVAAASILGVPEEHVVFLDYPDGTLTVCESEAIAPVQALLDAHRPEEVFVPCEFDGPDDHLATHRIVTQAVKRLGLPATVYEYAVWLWHHWPWVTPPIRGLRSAWKALSDTMTLASKLSRNFKVRVDISSEREQKLRALAAHKSQVLRLNDNPDWPILSDVADGAWLEACTQNVEMFFVHG